MPDAPAVCLMGPTGTGKTELALALAAAFDVEIISVDSALVYRYMDIGTAKPGLDARARVPHHLIDVLDPWEAYSAGRFRADAARLMADIRSRGRTPLLVGGTMLYFRALTRGLAPLPEADAAIRAALDAEAARIGWPAMHARLAHLDPVSAGRIRPGDRQRIQRALEVHELTGQRLSQLQATVAGDRPSIYRVALVPGERAELYRRLDVRLATMLRAGFLSEVRRLREMPLMTTGRPAMRAVGYRQLWQHLEGGVTLAEAQRQAVVATHRLAKRQLTWLRSESTELALDPFAAETPAALGAALAQLGVSRRTGRCNMMEQPIQCREQGV